MVGRAQADRSRITPHQLVLRPRAIAELRDAVEHYAFVGHDRPFLGEIDRALGAIAIRPLRFPVIIGETRRALVRRYPYAVFFRIRPSTAVVVVLAVLHQRMSPRRWPR